MQNKKELIIGVDNHFNNDYANFLMSKFNATFVPFNKLKDYSAHQIDFLLFTGGADVNPAYYNEKIGQYTGIDTKRDEEESNMWNNYYRVPKLGICRGAQFLTVMSGGKLVQHVTGHSGNHTIETQPGSIYEITSTHHQMMYPYNMKEQEFEFIAWSEFFKSNTYLNGENTEITLPDAFLEPEIVYYNKTKSLCIQGHPEFSTCPEKTKNYILQLINKYLITQ